MEAKEYLIQIDNLNFMINTRLKELKDLKLMAGSTGGFDYSGVRVKTSGLAKDVLAERVAHYVDLENEINRMIDNLIDTKHQIIGEIESLKDNNHIKILTLRYVNGKKLEEIAKITGYTHQWIRELHGQALIAFENEVLDKRKK